MYFLNALWSNPAYQTSISENIKTTQKKPKTKSANHPGPPTNQQMSHNSRPTPKKYSNCAGAEKLHLIFPFNSMTHSSNFSPNITAPSSPPLFETSDPFRCLQPQDKSHPYIYQHPASPYRFMQKQKGEQTLYEILSGLSF